MNIDSKSHLQNSEEISFSEILKQIQKWITFLLSQKFKIIIVGIIGSIIGFFYANYQPINYFAKLTFVVEEGKAGSANLGGLASLAGQFGVDVSGTGNSGVLSSDNILLYFKSESLIREVLLSPYDNLKAYSIADKYAEVYQLNEKWKLNENLGNIIFPIQDGNKKYTRLQDSLLNTIFKNIIDKQFEVNKTDKKSSFIEVSTKMKDEYLSKLFCEKIVEIAVKRYINLKTTRQKNSVDKLQYRADSIALLLNQKTYSGVSLQNNANIMDINPLYKTETAVQVEKTLRDKTVLATIFASVTQNLEMAKFALSQETPVIQIIDLPIMPLTIEKISKLKSIVIFSFVALMIFSVITIIRKLIIGGL